METPPTQPTLQEMLTNVSPFIQRVIGSQDDGQVAQALKTVSGYLLRHHHLVLIGQRDMVPIAYGIHARTLGEAPFMVVDKRRTSKARNVRSAASRPNMAAALDDVGAGTLCVRSVRVPRDWRESRPRLRQSSAHLALCYTPNLYQDSDLLLAIPPPLFVPSLEERTPEAREALIDAIELELQAKLQTSTRLSEEHRQLVLRTCSTLSELETLVTRLVLVANSKTLTEACGVIGCRTTSYSRWLTRRQISWRDVSGDRAVG